MLDVTDPVLADLLGFLGDSPTPFHAVASATSRLQAAGFRAIAETDDWSSLTPGRYAFAHGGSSVLAFVIPDGKRIAGFRIVGATHRQPEPPAEAHPEYKKEATRSSASRSTAVPCSTRGSIASLARRSSLRRPEGTPPKSGRTNVEARLVRFTRPMLRVAQLAIHLDRDVNDKGVAPEQAGAPSRPSSASITKARRTSRHAREELGSRPCRSRHDRGGWRAARRAASDA